jgi:hypothetical protein
MFFVNQMIAKLPDLVSGVERILWDSKSPSDR